MGTDIHASRNTLLAFDGAAHRDTDIHAGRNILLASEGATHGDTDIHAAKHSYKENFLKKG